MVTRYVRLRIEQDVYYVILLDDENQLSMIENELQQLMRQPDHPRYQAVSWHTGNTKSGLRYERSNYGLIFTIVPVHLP